MNWNEVVIRLPVPELTNGSGYSDTDYPALGQVLPALTAMPLLGEVHHTPLPPELLQEFESIHT